MSFLTLLSQISIFFDFVNYLNSEIQYGSNTQFNKYFKIFIFTYTSDFLNILRGTFLIFVKNIFYKHVFLFIVEYFFASVKLFHKNFTPVLDILPLC